MIIVHPGVRNHNSASERGGELTRAGQHDRKTTHTNQLHYPLAIHHLQCIVWPYFCSHCLCLLCSAGNGIRPGKKVGMERATRAS